MFPFLRFSAVTASIIVASTAFGFGLAATMLPTATVAQLDISNGPRVASPGSESHENIKTRSIAGYQAVTFKSRSIAMFDTAGMVNSPAMNLQGPTPGAAHANLGRRTRELVSACLIANAG